jgi:hypothetical protein
MVGIGEIAGFMSSLKAAKDIAETMIGLLDEAVMQAKVIEFQSKIADALSSAIAAQEERATLLQTVDDLKKEVANLKAWETQKQRYELRDAGNGALAYALKDDARSSDPAHWICAHCYDDAKRSILQPETRFRVGRIISFAIAARPTSSPKVGG